MKHDTNIELIGGSILVVMLTIKLDTQVTIGVNEQKPFEVAKSRANGSVHPHHHYHDHHRKGGSRREKERQFPRGQRSSQAVSIMIPLRRVQQPVHFSQLFFTMILEQILS